MSIGNSECGGSAGCELGNVDCRGQWGRHPLRHLSASQRRRYSPMYSLPLLAPEQYGCGI